MHILDQLLTCYLRRYNRKHMQLLPSAGERLRANPDKSYLLYIHIPFCEYLCPFCSFHRVKHNREWTKAYFDAVRREIYLYRDMGFTFSDVYVGGGTPTVDPEELVLTLQLLRGLFNISSISVETNPNHLITPVLQQLLDNGVNRLSVGVQSLDDSLLREMGRYQAYGSAEETIARLQTAQGKFATFNVDMIFNLPHQSIESLNNDLHRLKQLAVDQISWYPLMPAPLGGEQMVERMGNVDLSRERSFYYTILDTLIPDYRPGSAWCFSNKPAAIDEYIVDHDEYLGVGSGSFSYINGTIYSNTFSIKHYIELIGQGAPSISASQSLSIKEQAQYDFLIKLFGLTLEKSGLALKYGQHYRKLLWKELLFFKTVRALEETQQTYRLNRNGMYWWVLMMREFFIGVNNFRGQMREMNHSAVN